MARDRGGPTYYPVQKMPYPSFTWHVHTTLSIIVFLVPVIPFFLLLLSSRKKHWSSFSVVLLCFLSGFILTVVFGSSWWLVGRTETTMIVGPLRPPITGTLGMLAGLSHVNLTYITDNFTLNERVTWTTRPDLVQAHRTALREGWPWGLLSLTAELGGEGMAWRGTLGDGLKEAGLISSCLLLAAMYVWAVWVILFIIAPEMTACPLMLTGMLMAFSSLTYVICVRSHIPSKLMVGGKEMELHFGLSWWLTAIMGLVLTVVGCGLFLYDAKYPGYLSMHFEIDFGRESSRSFPQNWRRSQPLLAYSCEEEIFNQTYPRCRAYGNHQNSVPTHDKYKNENIEGKSFYQHTQNEITLPHESTSCTDSSQTESTPKIKYILENETRVLPEPLPVLIRSSTLAQHQEHTTLTSNPDTLRRRSPESTEQHMLPSQPATPLGVSCNPGTLPQPSTAPPSTCLGSYNPSTSHRTHGTSASPRPTFLIRSFRKSAKKLVSRDNSKLFQKASTRVTVVPSKKPKRSLSKMFYEHDVEGNLQINSTSDNLQLSTLF